MNLNKKQLWFLGIFALAVVAALWGIQNAERIGIEPDEPPVESIDWNEDTISDQDGNVLLSADNLPSSMEVSEEAEFGVAGSITSAQLSPDKEWIALSVSGAAHGAGWLYEITTGKVVPAAFQYGGGVEVIEWSPDGQFVAFRIGTPAATEHILGVNRDQTSGYVSEIGQQIEVEEQAGMNPPYAYEFIRWESPHTLCFSFNDGPEECREADQLLAESDEPSDDNDEPAASREVSLYYYSPEADTDADGNIMCSRAGLIEVERTITEVQTPLTSTLELLLEGELTEAEEAQGITTDFPLEGFSLEGVNLENGVATIEFSDPQNSSSGGSCRVSILYAQIEATATQFPEVDEIRIIPEDILQP